MHYLIQLQDISLKRDITRLQNAIEQPEIILGSIGESLLRVNRDRHNAGLAPDGTKWAPLKPSTLQEKRKGGILYKTGEMLRAFNYQVDADTLTLGFDGQRNANLATWHHEGTAPHLIKPLTKKALRFGGRFAKKVNHPGLPSRPLLGFPDSDQKLVRNLINDHLMLIIRDD